MECVNPHCTKRELLKKLFLGVKKAEELPEFCPFCGEALRSTTDGNRSDNTDLSSKAFERASDTTKDDSLEESDAKIELLDSRKGSKDHQNLIPIPLEGQTRDEHLIQPKQSQLSKNNEESRHGQEVSKDSSDAAVFVDHGTDQGTEHHIEIQKHEQVSVGDSDRTVVPSVESNTSTTEDVLHVLSKHSEGSPGTQNSSSQASTEGENSKEQTLHSYQSFASSGIDFTGNDKESTENQKAPIDPKAFDHETSHNSDIGTGLHHETQSRLTPSNNVSSVTKDIDNTSGILEKTPLEQDSNMTPINQEVGQSRHVLYPPGHDSKTTHGPSILGSSCVFGPDSSGNGNVSTGMPVHHDFPPNSSTGTTDTPQKKMETEDHIQGKKAFDHQVVEMSDDGDTTSDEEDEADNNSHTQRSGPQRYDEDVIKQKRKERRNKRKRGGNKAKKANNDIDDIEEKKQRIQDEQKPENSESKKLIKQTDNDDKMETTSGTEKKSNTSTQETLSHPLQHTHPNQQDISVPKVTWTEEECVTIIFHAFLSPEFHFKVDKHKVTVRLGLYEVGGWKYNCTDMFNVRKVEDNFIRVQGEMQLPVKFLQKPIAYKYVVIDADGKVDWELSEYFDKHHGIVDRCLVVIPDYKHQNAVWHQYDGLVYPDFRVGSRWYNPLTWVSGWKNKFDHAKVVKNREHAAISFLPKWEGFVIGGQIEQITALEAIDRMKHLKECLANPWISVSNYAIKKQIPFRDFPFQKILKDFLKPKISSNASLKEDELKKPDVRKGRLISSLTITHLVCIFDLDLSYAELADIIQCLVIEMHHGNGRCDFDDLHMEFPENTWGDLSKSVVHLLNAAKQKSGYTKFCPDIILAVPLLHFLRMDTKPFAKCDDDSDGAKSVDKWCHLNDLPRFNPYKKLVEGFFTKVQWMFVLDPYLRRLFLYYVPFEDFDKMCIHDKFPIHDLCNALGFKIEHERKYTFSSKLQMIEKTLSSLRKRIQKELAQRKHLDAEIMLQAKSGYFLATELFRKSESIINESFFLCIEIVSLILSSTQELGDEMSSPEYKSRKEECDAIFFSLTNDIEIAIEKEFRSKFSLIESRQKEELKIWTRFLEADSLKGKLRDKWCETLLSYFVKRLKKLTHNDSIDLYCRVDTAADNINQSIIDAITNHAFNEVERTVQSGKNESSISLLRKKCLKDGVSSRAGELLSRMIITSWNKDVSHGGLTVHTQLLYILRWKHWPEFISSFGSAESQNILMPDAAKLVKRVIDHLCRIQHTIRNRSIDVQTMVSLEQHKDNFRKLCTALTKVDKDSEDSQSFIETETVMKELEKRSEELRHFHELKRHVGNFLNMCRSTKEVIFDTADLQRLHECDISVIEMKDICSRDSMSEEYQENQITVVFFDLPDSLRSELPQLSAFCKSDLFQSFWRRNSRSTYKEKQNNQDQKGLSLTDIQKSVFQPSLETWKHLAQKLYSGFISLRDIDKYFTKIDLQKEVGIMFSSFKITKHEMDVTMKQRMKQINQYRSLQKYIEATETVWEFKEALELKGDFEIVEQLRNQSSAEFKEKALTSIDSKFLQAGEYLKSISIKEAHCLQAVINCEPLVKWLRETIKDTSALSTLVDLAMISAGENDLEVDRISNFHTSCLNFAPLIFDIRKDSGFDDLMKACQPVWKAVEADKHLPNKLSETCQHLDWLKAVQSSHGSVEMSSLMQTKIINSSGVYRIGNIAQSLDFKNGLEGVLTLTVPMDERIQDPKIEFEDQESTTKEDMKAYSLNDLKTLQSKLMLIAGKTAQLQNKEKKDSMESTEEINRFVEIFEGVMRLGQVYIDLCEAGDVKYLEWSEKIDCFEDRLFIDRSVGKKIAITCKEMEERLLQWRQYVHDKRHKYKELNHFSTQQILIMRRELGSLRRASASISNLPLHVLTLLESVLSGITNQDLVEVLNKISGFILVATDSISSETPMEESELNSADPQSKGSSFFISLEKMDYQEDVGIAALKAMNAFDSKEINETDLLDWCMENGDNTEIIESLVEQAREDPNFAEFFPEMMDNQDDLQDEMMSDEGDNNQTEDNSELDIEHEYYLTLNELGTVLVELGKRGNKPSERRFPDYLKNDQPNLILVPSVDVYPTVLTLYMQYGGNSLPTPNEVLLCTSETSAEEVELFWWRAFQDTNKQIFCLVNPDVLDYNVSQTSVAMFNTLKQTFGSFQEHRVVIICSTENEDRSHIIAALDEYRLHATPTCALGDTLKSYLEEKLTSTESRNGYYNNEKIEWIPAAHLDAKRLSVRVISSNRAGVGKSLVVTRLCEKLMRLPNNERMFKIRKGTEQLSVTVPLHGSVADTRQILDALWQHPLDANLPLSRIIHVDVSPSINEGLETVLFNLVVLGVLQDTNGRLWRRRSSDLYVIERTNNVDVKVASDVKKSSFLSLFPTIDCITPIQTLQLLKTPQISTSSPLFDSEEFRSVPLQRAFQYLFQCDRGQSLDRYQYDQRKQMGTPFECLALVIRHCGISDPSWSELKHFIDFLNSQLHDCEQSYFTNPANFDDQWMQGTLKGFKSFVVRFMVTMSRDFATPSLDDNPIVCSAGASSTNIDEDIRPLQLRRKWESSSHPYIFFNQDRITMTFLGFHVQPNGNLIDPDTFRVIEAGLMTKQLQQGLALQKVDLNANYNAWTKLQRIGKLCMVMGLENVFDPDPTYELTIDNMKKILAIHMRFRCGIPVVIMGETGCGKTRLIRYMCALQAGSAKQRNMLLMKVHGGTSYKDITTKVEQAEKMASENGKKGIDTVLFFDEANTTEALGMIKEVMVDRRINGRPVGVGLRRLHFIAACNPYRRHTDKMIGKLESAGLGYSVKATETKDKLGKIPLRHLVYRVHALPASMRPLVWDFGQLKPEIEELYIRQIVNRFVVIDKVIPGNERHVQAIARVLAAAQKYMRKQQDECSFVSLRDVERTMTVMTWFYQHHKYLRPQAQQHDSDDEQMSDSEEEVPPVDMVTWSLLLSLGVCYHAKLQDRKVFRDCVIKSCSVPLKPNGGQKEMLQEIDRCQKVLINELNLGPNIARNTALSENVFMMVVCIELRIPLFVIGKPGSSKSLAKTVVADNMQGEASKSPLFKRFKRAHMVSYQCSPLSTPEGIVATFRQCRRLQENNPGGRYASVVVLDEVGLAEDSPLLPLKTLHPLLEDGVTSSDDIIETDEKPTRVAFIGISNWALDPAKMNRGLMLMRAEPDKKELEDSAWGICAAREDIRTILSRLLKQLADGYADLYKRQKTFQSLSNSKRDEFFGLRDFYSLVKMVYSIAADKGDMLDWSELEHAIRRNFGGLDEIDAVKIFKERVKSSFNYILGGEPVKTLDLLRASLDHKNAIGESRYLLVITENYSALTIVEQQLIKNKDDYVVIFGSSFPKDQEYTQVCRNINQIKICMETGRTVVLLNLESLYESLYDALNQYYVYCAGQKYVDLGLGSHRVKCRVDDTFRLIVIAEKDVVYKKFPIPLINRLEKHYLVTSKSLERPQLNIVEELRNWAQEFAEVRRLRHERQEQFTIADAFIGYQSDTLPSMVLQVSSEDDICDHSNHEWAEQVKTKCQSLLLQTATPDAIARLPKTALKDKADDMRSLYFVEQEHSSLSAYLGQVLSSSSDVENQNGLLLQVSTHSRLLSENDLPEICDAIGFKRPDVKLLHLQQFQTEQQFLKQIREFFIELANCEGIVLVQCDSGDDNFNLIACTRHLLMDHRVKRQEMLTEKLQVEYIRPLHFIIIVQLPRLKGGCVNFVGFQGGHWESVHVDDLRPPSNQIPPIEFLIDRPISDLLKPSWLVEDEDVDTDLVEQGQNLSLEDIDVDMSDEVNGMEIDYDNEMFRSTPVASRLGQKTSKETFDAIVLIRRSIQAAAGRLEDEAVLAKRTTDRIDLILNLLPENSSKITGGPSFSKSLHQKIYELLQEKNEKVSGELASYWVRNEALSGTRMHERGTFRKALQYKVLSEIEPLLAKVLAFADRDCNLNLLVDDNQWLKSLWVHIFENKHLNEKYFDVSDTNMIREHVNVSGRGKHVFQCRFPFSWLVKDMVDGLGRGGSDVSNRSCGTEEEKLRSILENSDLKDILDVVKEEGNEEEASERYLHDFVHMVYFPTKQCEREEIELVSRFIMMAAEKENDSEEYIFDIATIHVTFNRIKSRITNFNQMVQIEPDITRLLLNQRQMSIDVAALTVSLEKLEPILSELQSQEARNLWCGKVLAIRSSIEEMTSREAFSRKSDDMSGYDDNEKDLLRDCWMMWQRLSAIRLFIAHVCNTRKSKNSRYLAKLSKVLGRNTNFLTTRSVRSLEKFLVECSHDFREQNKIDTTCSVCMAEAKCPSLTPCNHCFCLDCINHWMSSKDSCPKCRVAFPAGFKPTESEKIKNANETISNFRDQCNSYFMEVVSLFCFGYSPCGVLGEDTYNLLMSYVTGQQGDRTKPFSPFMDAMDVTPVVRSFLLQQLLKSSDQKVKDYMTQFIQQAQDLVQVELVAVEVLVMCVQCMEDAQNGRFSKRASELPLEHKVPLIDKFCKKACSVLSNRQCNQLNVDWLEGIALLRFSLSLAADLMYQFVNGSQEMQVPTVQRALRSIFDELQKFFSNTTYTKPRLFFLKQLSRRFGFESIGLVAKKFGWILPQEGSETFEVSQDRFLAYGREYQSLRETLARSIITGDMKDVEDIRQGMTLNMTSKNVVLLLGLFQEITANPGVPIPEVVMKSLSSFIQESTSLNDSSKHLAQDLITEEHQDTRTIASVFGLAGHSAWDTSLVEIVVHLASVLCSKGNDGIVGPLIALALNPASCINSFLPTMPDDPNQEVRAAVKGTMYECMNGHPYLVTECGRPVEKSRCRARGCGAEIGGVNHVPVSGNRAANTADLTKRGHCLGSPNDRGGTAEAAPERDLSPLATCLIRLLVHGSMLIGSCYNLQSVTQLISPNIRQNTVQMFLWQHLMRDIHLVSRVSGRNVDDTALTIHLLLQNISCQALVQQPNGWNVLQDKTQRRRWENHFSTVVIVPVMNNLGHRLQETLQLIAKDKRFGANPLLRQLYELESGAEDLTRSITPNCTALWRYRTPITLNHVTRKFNESAVARSADCVILGEFLKQEHDLRVVKHLPDVVKLQKLLMDRYHRSLDRTETDKIKLKDFYRQIPKGTVAEYKGLVQSFRSAWVIMVASVKDKGTKGSIKKLCENKVQDDTPISMFIPAKSGLGACSLTLVKFLVDKHNEFLEVYRQHAQIKDIQHVGLLEVTCSQLISYDADRDLIPLVHAHCHYSLEPGQGTSVEYDWSAVQRHLIDRLIRGRSIVDFKDEEYTKTAVINAQSVLKSLKAKIHQVELTLAIQHQIVQQYRSLQDVCEAVSSLHIAITFLSSGGGSSDMPISRYLHDVLKMPADAGLRNNKANEVCQLQHSVSLWRILSIERAKRLTRSGKDPFEHLPDDYKESVSEAMQISVRETLRKLSDANLDVLVSLLIEIIILQLNDDFEIDMNYSLKEYITYNPLHEDSEMPTEVDSIPETVKLRHVFGFWQILISLSDRSSHERRVQPTC